MSSKGKSKVPAGGSSAALLKSPPGIEVETSEPSGDPVPGKISEREWSVASSAEHLSHS